MPSEWFNKLTGLRTMNETVSDHLAKESARFPIKLTLWTVFAIAVIWLLYSNIGQLNDRFNLDPASPTIAAVVLLFLTWLMWLGWSMFRLGSLLVAIVIFAVPVSFLSLYYICLLYTSPSPRDGLLSRMPSSA